LKAVLPPSVVMSGPAPSPLAKAKGLFRHQILLRSRDVRTISSPLKVILKTFKWPSKVTCSIDVDAISLS